MLLCETIDTLCINFNELVGVRVYVRVFDAVVFKLPRLLKINDAQSFDLF